MSQDSLPPGERLARSRERLRVALRRDTDASSNAGAGLPGVGVLEILKTAMPGASVFIDALGHWWAQHPWRGAAGLAQGGALAVLRPIAQRQPMAVAGAALAAGLLLGWIRPWRWLQPGVRSTAAPAILPTVLSTLLSSALASGALQAWLRTAMAPAPTPSPTSAPDPTPAPTEPPPDSRL